MGDHGQNFIIRFDSFLRDNVLHPAYQFQKINGAKGEMLTTGSNRVGNLVRFRCAENEDHPLGRLLQSLQKRIKSFFGNLVRFVDDENFVLVTRRAITDILSNFAHLVNAAIGRRVNFDHIDR